MGVVQVAGGILLVMLLPARTAAGASVVAALVASGCSSGPGDGRPASGHGQPAPAAVRAPSTYLALGDSVAAGVGAATPRTGGYVPLLAALLEDELGCDGSPTPGCPLELRNLAVSGATTASLLRDQLPAAREMLRGEPDVRLVTVTVGGNDVFAPVLAACSRAPRAPACREAVVAALGRVDVRVDELLAGLASAADPGTTVAVMTYYDPVSACRLAPLQPLADQVLEGDGEQPGLNDVLRARAAEHGAVVVETRERLRSPDDFVGGDDCLHPSGSGHARIAQAFLEAVAARVAAPR